MKLDLKTAISHGSPEQVQEVLLKEFGANLPIQLIEDFACKPEAALILRCNNGQVVGIVRQLGVITRGIRDVASNIKAILYWRDSSGFQARVLEG